MISNSKQLARFIALFSFLMLSTPLFAQNISVPGITGVDFDTTGGSYTIIFSTDFNVHGIDITSSGLTLSYNSDDETLSLYGTASAGFDGETMPVGFGDAGTPGLVITNGTLTSVSLSITETFDLRALSITPTDLTLEYDATDNHFEIYGLATATIDGNAIDLSLGDADDPGVIIKSGLLTHINFGITTDFDMKGITISPTDLTLEYDAIEIYYEFYGDLTVKFDGEEVDAGFGDADDPGMVYDSTGISHINFSLTGEFDLKSLAFIPDNLTFEYDSEDDHFEMYGDITFKIGSDEITANMGDADNPGLIYNNGSITHVNIGITEDFSINGLTIKTTDLGAEWNSDSGSDYHIYGEADLSIAGEDIDVNFGTFNEPGIVVQNGDLHSFEVDVNSDLKLGNLEVETEDLDIKYSSNKFEVSGTMSITEVFSLSVTLGEDDEGGLEIDVSGSEPRFKVEALEIDIEHANLGAIDLKKLLLKFDSNGIVESDVSVIFPEGWEVDAIMKFTGSPAKLNSIEIDYIATNLAQAIEIFEGVQLSFLGASVDNLTDPSNLTVTGTIETIYGGGFSLAGHSATLLQMRDQVTIEPHFFEIEGDVNVGAYRTGTDSWHALLGSGDVDLKVGTITYRYRWPLFSFGNHHSKIRTHTWTGVRASVNIKIPGHPLIEADATVTLDTHRNFDALVDVEFIVPHWVPFIGGKHYGSVDGAVRYKHGDLHHSYGAGWVRVKTFWKTYHVGAKYNFGSRKVSSFTHWSTIQSIQNDIKRDQGKAVNDDTGHPDMKVYSFEAPKPNPNSMLIDINWAEPVDSALIIVIGPEGNYELTKAVVVSENDSTTTPTLTYEENMDIVVGDTVSTFMYTSPSAFHEDSTLVEARLLDGRHQLVIFFFNEATEIDTVTFNPSWQIPKASITAEKTVDNRFALEIDYWSSEPDSTILSFYVSPVPGYTETDKLVDHVYASNFDEHGSGIETFELIPDFITEFDTLYFYGVIEDGANPPIRTEVTEGFEFQPDIVGQLVFPDGADSLQIGQRVFIDEDVDGSFDVESTGGLEFFAITDSSGYFAISGLTADENYELRIVLPEGYRIIGETDRFGHELIEFDGTPQTLLITMEAYTEED